VVKAQQAATGRVPDASPAGEVDLHIVTCVGCNRFAGVFPHGRAHRHGPDPFASRKRFAGSLMASTPDNLTQ